MKYVLAIDLGTSGPKSALVSIHGKVIDYAFVENKVNIIDNGGAEQDPQEWFDTIISTSKKILNRNIKIRKDVVAVSITSQWSGTVAIDENGKHLHDAVIWLDSRGSKYIDSITKGLVKVEGYGLKRLLYWLRKTGGVPTRSGKDSIAHILWFLNEKPDVYQKTYKFLEPKDYLNYRFTNKIAASYDSIALHWVTDNRDINNIQYDKKLIKYTGIDEKKLPELKHATDVLGTIDGQIAKTLRLNEDVKVMMGTPDMHSASVGSGAVKDFDTHLYIGTSSWLCCHVPFKKTDIMHNIASLPSALPGKYFVPATQESAGACLNYLKNNILYHEKELLRNKKEKNIYQIFDTMVKSVPAGNDKVIFTPWLFGERTPIEDSNVRGILFNQSLSTTREHIVRAVFEGVAFNSRWLLETLEKFIKKNLTHVNMIGGGANSDIWCQIHADVFNREIRQVSDPIQANVIGAAFIAALGLGLITEEDITSHTKIKKVYKPNSDNRKLYDSLFKEFKNLYKQNKKIFARLNKK